MSSSSPVEYVVDTERKYHVSLLCAKYLLFSASESNSLAALSGRDDFVKCVLIKTREQLTCKVRGQRQAVKFFSNFLSLTF